ncbi:hypothetical protein PybrP1_008853 [[Pythium] brassicae (nom. inval.)]|nr:hypothetical protein PybrP1_008853 [[Pythium] brassicae (nom. inval.)]
MASPSSATTTDDCDGIECRRERAKLLATIARQQEESARLAKRFKLLQRTLVDQQTLLERYQRASTSVKTVESPRLTLEEDPAAKTKEPAAGELEKPQTATEQQPQQQSASLAQTKSDASDSAARASALDCAPDATAAPAPVITAGVRRASNRKAATTTTWAQEKLRMQAAGIVTKRRVPGLRVDAAQGSEAHGPGSGAPQPPPSSGTADDFKFVEVVRNREARAALPGHDCAECRKYYAALEGLIPDADMALAKAACSRHRARFEPYNTPDDFWRLSFPDSASPPLSP